MVSAFEDGVEIETNAIVPQGLEFMEDVHSTHLPVTFLFCVVLGRFPGVALGQIYIALEHWNTSTGIGKVANRSEVTLLPS